MMRSVKVVRIYTKDLTYPSFVLSILPAVFMRYYQYTPTAHFGCDGLSLG